MISSDLDKSRFFDFVGRDFGTARVLVARKSGAGSSTVVFLLACCHEQHCQHDGTHSYLSFPSDFLPPQRCQGGRGHFENRLQTTTECEVTLLLQLQRTKDGVLSPQWARE